MKNEILNHQIASIIRDLVNNYWAEETSKEQKLKIIVDITQNIAISSKARNFSPKRSKVEKPEDFQLLWDKLIGFYPEKFSEKETNNIFAYLDYWLEQKFESNFEKLQMLNNNTGEILVS